MALSVNSNNYQKRRGRRVSLMGEINVTPLVDVMLVLLIVFMITSPMLVSGVNVDLPKTDSVPLASKEEPLVISINKEGELYIVESKINLNDLVTKLQYILQEKKDTPIFIKGDKNIDYGFIVNVLTKIHQAGYSKVGLLSDASK